MLFPVGPTRRAADTRRCVLCCGLFCPPMLVRRRHVAEEAPAKKAPAKKAPAAAKKGDAAGEHETVTVERILKMANTPKKEKKFVNFCKNTFKLTDEKEIGSLWTGYKKAKGI